MTEENIKNIKHFIKNSSNFWEDHNINYLDKKHRRILKLFEKKYKKNIKLFSEEIINWESQTNLGAPYQLNKSNIKYKGIKASFVDLLKYILRPKLDNHFQKISFEDDLQIIKLNNGLDILKDNPIHKFFLNEDCYFISKNVSTNNRWNRYIYLASQIRKFKLLNKSNKNWLDIGSFYGGLQIILKKYNKNQNFFLLDFNHQLCRSYALLKRIYPNSNHILPNEINSLKKDLKNTFVYIPIKDFKKIKKIKFDLITNFFSFGEMSRNFFNYYLKSEIINNTKSVYLVNRFVSSPWFEPTYDNDLTYEDYKINKFNLKYLDVFPIHHYKNIKRNLFGLKAHRCISSPYFEKIIKK